MARWRWRCAAAAMAAGGLLAGCELPRGGGAAPGSLLEADRRFAAQTQVSRTEGWVSAFAEDGVMLLPGTEVKGRDAIREAMAGLFADAGYTLVWEPVREEIAAGGDLGYTVGRFRGVQRGAGRERIERTGQYVTIWRRGAEGEWEVVLDVGVPDPAPAGADIGATPPGADVDSLSP